MPAELEIGGTFDLPKFDDLEGYALLCLVRQLLLSHGNIGRQSPERSTQECETWLKPSSIGTTIGSGSPPFT